jgi:inner membrane protein
MLWGAVCGTLPDLDVFVPLGDAVRDFTYHRSASHSLLVLAALTPLIVWLITKLHPDTRAHWRGWAITIYLVFATHVLLDSVTIYGTQILWPLSDHPFGLGAIFIIDPAYTLPLVAGVLIALFVRAPRRLGLRANRIGLALSSAYLVWAIAAQQHVEAIARASLAEQGIAHERLLILPTPFNSVLWRVLAVHEHGYAEGVYSLLDAEPTVALRDHPSRPELLEGIEDHWPVARLRWFTHGHYRVRTEGKDVVITDLRMGMEPGYVFAFKVGELTPEGVRPTVSEQRAPVRDWGRLPELIEPARGLPAPTPP